jgi:hypothetical protein
MVAVDNTAPPRQDTGKLSSSSPALPGTACQNIADVPASVPTTAREDIELRTSVLISVPAALGVSAGGARGRVARTRQPSQRLPKEEARDLPTRRAGLLLAGLLGRRCEPLPTTSVYVIALPAITCSGGDASKQRTTVARRLA